MPTEPVDPPAWDVIALEHWKVQFKQYNERLEDYHDFLTNLYNLIMGQCTIDLEDQIKSHVDYAAASQDGVQLLQIIKQLTYSLEDCKKLSDALCDLREGFYQMRQGKYKSLKDFYEQLKNHVTMMDEVGAIFADDSHVGQVAMMNG